MPILGDILGYFGAGAASKKAQEGYLNAIHGIGGAVNEAAEGGARAVESAKGQVATGTTGANQTLADVAGGLKENLQPYLMAGSTGAGMLTGMSPFSFSLGDWQKDPGFRFQLEQGTNAIQNAASARGLAASGNTLKDLTTFGQGLANTYYGQAFNRALQGFGANVGLGTTLADIGLAGSGQLAQTQQNAGNRIAENLTNQSYYGGQSDINLANFLARLKMGAATTAGELAVGKGQAAAAGATNKAAALSSGIRDIGNLALGFL